MPNMDMINLVGLGSQTELGLDQALRGGMPGELPGGDVLLNEQPAFDIPEEGKQEEQEISAQYKLTPDEKHKIVEYIIKLVDDCTTSRITWQETKRECMDLLHGIRSPKSDPWPNCSNLDVMVVPTHCKLMHAKLLPAIYNENLVFWRPVEISDVVNVEQVSKFMRWVMHQDIRFQNIADDITWLDIINGTVAIKLRWGVETRRVADKDENGSRTFREIKHERLFIDNVNVDDVYFPQLWIDEDTSEFIAQNVYMRLPDVEDLINKKIWLDDDRGRVDAKLDEVVPDSLKKKQEEILGIDNIISAHKDSQSIRFIECYMRWMIDGVMRESVFVIGYESHAYMSGKPLEAVFPVGTRPWVIGQFIRMPGSPYGLSLIEVMRGLAKELNAIHNQRIDAGSIAIAPFGFYRAASSFKPEIVQIGPGVMIPVDDIKDVNVIQLQHNPVASFQEERIIIEYIEKLTNTSAYQMGRESDIVKSRATASATLAIMSQGEQAFTILGIRMQDIISRVQTKALQFYQCFMPIGYADRILGEKANELLFKGGLKPEEISGGYDAYMTLDPTVANKATERQANLAMIQMASNLIALAQDPRGYEMATEFLKSIGKVEIEKYLGPKPQPKPIAQGMTAMGGGEQQLPMGNLPVTPQTANVMPQGGGGV